MNVITQKTLFEAKCTACGGTARVPFEPTEGKPVYCKECYAKHNARVQEQTRRNVSFESKHVWARRRNR
ncbi:MAG: hypothetical protein NWF04_05650 [Candidatus Bathyarchaeota archaeon]|nr:hypothetical protein [Candidatus Bathyarchaeota archaeon]